MVSNSFGQLSTIDEKVDSLLSLMTLEEKIGQMTQAERGSLDNLNDIATYSIGSLLSGGGSAPSQNTPEGWVAMYDQFQSIALQSRLGIPLIYGIDAVHGHNNVKGAVIFPHNIGLGCTWNESLVREVNKITAIEVAGTGIDWTFAPCIAVPRNERWGRTYEGFGESPELQEMMSKAAIEGLQGNSLGDRESILACAKHYVGDGGTANGIDQGNTQINEDELRNIHLPGYIEAIESGVGSIMASYNSWNGQKLHGHDYLLNQVLKNELGFDGFVISDWKGVDQIHGSYREAIKRAINAGIDMVMVPDRYKVFIAHLKSLVEDNEVSLERINDATRRILKQKFLLDLFNEPYTDPSLTPDIGSEGHRQIGRQAVRESMVLLSAKNDILPLKKTGQKILVAGRLADDRGAQCGGWSISWQGSNGEITEGTTILDGLRDQSQGSFIIYSEEGDYEGEVDVAVVVIGEKTPYAEGAGDRASLNLDQNDLNMISKIKKKGIPVIALLISGRPLILGSTLAITDAAIAAWYPGTEGDGVADFLYGNHPPTGKLGHSWPATMKQVPINIGDNDYNPLFVYKHGLSSFPKLESADHLNPYAASTNSTGDQILLTLSDAVSEINMSTTDLRISINGNEINNGVDNLIISPYDSSILLLDLNITINNSDDLYISYSGNGIQSSNLSLNEFTDLFVYNAVGIFDGTNRIPGRVEAENYSSMQGIQTEACEDVGGGINVGYIEAGDWLKYNLEVSTSANYLITSRISGYMGGELLLIFNDDVQSAVNYTSTNGWQNWKDFTSQVYLEKGFYEMQALAQMEAFNINYFDFDLISSNETPETQLNSILVFPNPIFEEFTVKFVNYDSKKLNITLIDQSGKFSTLLFDGPIVSGQNDIKLKLDQNIPAGSYYLELMDGFKRYFYQVVKE